MTTTHICDGILIVPNSKQITLYKSNKKPLHDFVVVVNFKE